MTPAADRKKRGSGVSQQFVPEEGGVGHNLSCTPQGPEGVEVLAGWQIAANHLSRENDMLQSALVFGSGSSVPDGDGGGKDELINSCFPEKKYVI